MRGWLKWSMWRTLIALFVMVSFSCHGQESVAREWNEVLLQAIRNDLARPTVHARNLFHTSIAMYDAWALYDEEAEPFFVGKTVGGFTCPPVSLAPVTDVESARHESISYAVYRLLRHRFSRSPGASRSLPLFDNLLLSLGYDPQFTSIDYVNDGPAALGNFIAANLISFGFQDGAREGFDYSNAYYRSINSPLVVEQPGNPDISDYNRWQPLTLDVFIDQSGNEIPFNTPDFLSPEWGNVVPFALTNEDLNIRQRDGNDWLVYHDPGPPAYLDPVNGGGTSAEYQWGHALVAVWSAQLSPDDEVMIDISPASLGNLPVSELPTTIAGLRDFYDLEEGGDPSQGHDLNPITGEPYAPQIVHRGDYTRILAEFWADGPDSETPPGHWFTILNTVNNHPQLRKSFRGEGPELDDLEWDVKTYLTLGGAMHDVAITVWGVKGYYDYIRPVSAIRAMGDLGQSTDPEQPSYHPGGLPLVPGYIEVVLAGDPLAGANNEHLGKMKLKAWRGPDYVSNPAFETAGVGWILSENWWPYQRPSFVTPNFAGYVSGHSTYSRAAAEVLTALTGDAYFPGGIGRFEAPQNNFLVFEAGPSEDITLEWATYRDASDQCSLSRIWGGIHPPVDDIPGRLMGIEIANDAFALAESLFYKDEDEDGFLSYQDCDDNDATVYPGAPEICDGKDNNCDDEIDEGVQSAFYADTDADGFGDQATSIMACNAPMGYVSNADDCNDTDALEFPGQSWYYDRDGDGYGDVDSDIVVGCSRPADGFLATELTEVASDCNDANASEFPGQSWYLDRDRDGYGAETADVIIACQRPADGFLATELIAIASDCNDNNAFEFPGQVWYLDVDDDGYSTGQTMTMCMRPTFGFLSTELLGISGDCDDNLAVVYPGAMEICDGIDNDCDNLVDEELTSYTYYKDADGDGFGNPFVQIDTCLLNPPPTYVTNSDDCRDSNAAIYLGATEIPDNGIDEDCNGVDLFLETKLFPNPVIGQLTIHLAEAAQVRIELYDVQGRLVGGEDQLFANNSLQLDCRTYAPALTYY